MANPVNLLVLDEPTNHLDLPSCDLLEDALSVYPGTVLLVTHDRHLIRNVADSLIVVRDGTATLHPGVDEDLLRPPGLSTRRTAGGSTAGSAGGGTGGGRSETGGGTGVAAGAPTSRAVAAQRRRAGASRRQAAHDATAGLRQELTVAERAWEIGRAPRRGTASASRRVRQPMTTQNLHAKLPRTTELPSPRPCAT